jgi:hypothetical protein
MKRLLLTLVLLLSQSVATPWAAAQDRAAAVDMATAGAAEAEALQQQLDASWAELNTLVSRIDALKSTGDLEGPNAVLLQQLLQQADARVAEMEALDARARQAASSAAEAARAALAEIRAERAQIERELEDGWLPTASQQQTLIRLDVLEEQFETPIATRPALQLDAIRANLTLTPEELRATADEIADEAARVERDLAELEERVEAAERRDRLQQRARDMAFDEAFFDDNASRRAPNRTSQAGVLGDAQRVEATRGDANAPVFGSDDQPTSEGAPELAPGDDAEAGGGGGIPSDGDNALGGFGDDAPPDVSGTEDRFSPPTVLNPDAMPGALPPADPTLLRNDAAGAGTGAGRRGRGSAAQLRAERDALETQLRALQGARESLLQDVEALERDLRK